MRNGGLRLLLIGWMVLFAAVYAHAGEAQGYKIALASYPTFDEAKQKLQVLNGKIGEKERSLQAHYQFKIAARPSGKMFMLAVEPFKTKEDANEVLNQFKNVYPDAYVSGYYGPTEGAVYLEYAVTPVAAAEPAAAASAAEPVAAAEPAAAVSEQPVIDDAAAAAPAPSYMGLLYELILAVIVIFVLLEYIAYRIRIKKAARSSVEHVA